jgi:hypothetical protein
MRKRLVEAPQTATVICVWRSAKQRGAEIAASFSSAVAAAGVMLQKPLARSQMTQRRQVRKVSLQEQYSQGRSR